MEQHNISELHFNSKFISSAVKKLLKPHLHNDLKLGAVSNKNNNKSPPCQLVPWPQPLFHTFLTLCFFKSEFLGREAEEVETTLLMGDTLFQQESAI